VSGTNPYKAFVARYLARGAVGVSLGLAAVTPVSVAHASTNSHEEALTASFSERLRIVRSAVSEQIKESDFESPEIARSTVSAFKNFTNFTNFRNFRNFTNFKNSKY
jgi:hypothetical protein